MVPNSRQRGELFAVFIILLSVALPGRAVAPRAVPIEPVYDEGAVPQGSKIVHDFVLQNDGDATLKIAEVRPGCGCTVVDFAQEIAAGESGAISVTLDTGEFAGPIAKGLRVFTNDAANPEIQLVIKADVKVWIKATPGYTRFIYVTGEEAPSDKHVLYSPSGNDFEVLAVRSPYPFVQASYRRAASDERESGIDGTQWVIELAATSKAPVGALADYIEVQTDYRRQQTVRIPIAGYVQPVIGITPAEADFGERRLTEAYRSTFEVRNFSQDDQIALVGVTSDVPGITAEIYDLKGKRFEVRVTLAPSMAKGDFEGTLRVRTNSTLQPEVVVPVRGRVL